jgi:undecaprenyl diphosphate synthase
VLIFYIFIARIKNHMTENTNTPKHIAIIMDGNRRWASERGLPKLIGHTEGGKNLKKILETALKNKIEYLTVWALSTENLKERTPEELNHLFDLFEKLVDYLGDFKTNNVKMKLIGNLEKIPKKTEVKLRTLEEETRNNTGMVFVLAVNYGGHDEIIRTINKLISNKLEINEENITNNLDTKDFPAPDMIIRTGGTKRLSGFMSWLSAYSELYFTDKKWPEFSPQDLKEAIEWFKTQTRNYGK